MEIQLADPGSDTPAACSGGDGVGAVSGAVRGAISQTNRAGASGAAVSVDSRGDVIGAGAVSWAGTVAL